MTAFPIPVRRRLAHAGAALLTMLIAAAPVRTQAAPDPEAAAALQALLDLGANPPTSIRIEEEFVLQEMPTRSEEQIREMVRDLMERNNRDRKKDPEALKEQEAALTQYFTRSHGTESVTTWTRELIVEEGVGVRVTVSDYRREAVPTFSDDDMIMVPRLITLNRSLCKKLDNSLPPGMGMIGDGIDSDSWVFDRLVEAPDPRHAGLPIGVGLYSPADVISVRRTDGLGNGQTARTVLLARKAGEGGLGPATLIVVDDAVGGRMTLRQYYHAGHLNTVTRYADFRQLPDGQYYPFLQERTEVMKLKFAPGIEESFRSGDLTGLEDRLRQQEIVHFRRSTRKIRSVTLSPTLGPEQFDMEFATGVRVHDGRNLMKNGSLTSWTVGATDEGAQILGDIALEAIPSAASLRAPEGRCCQFASTRQEQVFSPTDNAPLAYRFEFTNTCTGPVRVAGIRSDCGCITPEFPADPIAPGAKGTVRLVVDRTRAQSDTNGFSHTATVALDLPGAITETVKLTVAGKWSDPAGPSGIPAEIDFGVVGGPAGGPMERCFTLSRPGGVHMGKVDLDGFPADLFLKPGADPDSMKVCLSLRADKLMGAKKQRKYSGTLRLETISVDTGKRITHSVRLKAAVEGQPRP